MIRTKAGLLVLAALAVWALADLLADAAVNAPADLVGFARRTWPLDFPAAAEILTQTGRTLAVVLLATILAVLIGVPLAVAAATRGRLAARALLTVARATPDVVLAVVFVRFFGLGALPAVLGMGLHSAGMVGKLYAEAIEHADVRPRHAVRAVGASPVQEFVTGVLPQVVPAFIAIGLHRFDINLRISAILGFVGAAGIGTEMALAFGRLDYPRGMAWAVILFVVLLLVEVVSAVLRGALLRAPGRSVMDRPIGRRRATMPPLTLRRIVGYLAVVVTAALVGWSVTSSGVLDATLVDDASETLALFWPPDSAGVDLLAALLVTLQVALAGTLLGAVFAVPLGSLAARNVAPNRWMYGSGRALVLVVRGLPELVLGIVFVVLTGLGPVAGVLALALGATGLLGKLVADSLENLPPGPAVALRAVGASRLQTYVGATLPQAAPILLGQVLYQLDAGIRAATLLGLVGAGGIGLYLLQAMRTREYPVVTLVLLMILGVLLGVETLTSWLNRKVR
ncbi:PhnE/PtxC family ABC transporter permease [Solwaraspora sp. WMMB335]|uniref:PhnE/PtxC family ABC transporter permease n=1 Tax=Solwaraspora sp. WMMB335 TaxID=3404118 RepID=UPI003B95D72C